MKIRGLGVHVQQEGPGPLNSNSIICSISIFPANFFVESILSQKNWRGGLRFQTGAIDGY